jgi:biotin carboxylase
LTAYAENLFRELGWSGLACAEFIRNEQGEYYFLEMNPRPWAAIQAAHVCGVPLLRSFASYLLGKEIPPQKDFKENKEICLFPQYFIHMINKDGHFNLKYFFYYLKCLAVAPWLHPRLLLSNLRTILWSKI